MIVDTKLREASESVRQARRQAHFTNRSPSRRPETRRGPIMAVAAAFVLLALVALPVLLLPAPDESGVAANPSQSPEPGAIGGDGPYFGVEDPDWTLDSAWRIALGDGSSFILYKNGNRQISTMTGEAAEEATIEINELDGTKVNNADTSVDVYQWNEGVSYVWETSDGTPVVITFGQMTINDAENLTNAVISIDEKTFADMVATNPVTPTTIATEDTDS